MVNQCSRAIAMNRLRMHSLESWAGELQRVSWPVQLPHNIHGCWMLVREQLHQRTLLQLPYLRAQAVTGSQASNSAAAVQFKSLAELLAFLLRDIALGQAADKWYWQPWHCAMRNSSEEAIAQILGEYIAEWPALVEELAAIGQLSLLWQMISSGKAAALIVQLRRHYGIAAPLSANRALLEMTLEEQHLTHAAQRQLQQQPHLFKSWFPALAHLATEDKRWQLAALISGISYCPLLLMRSPNAVVKAFIRCCNRWQPLLPFSQTLTREIFVTQLSKRPLLPQLTPGRQHIERSWVSSAPDSTGESLPQTIVEKIDPASKDIFMAAADITNFTIQKGGFFYLINALRPLLTAELLAATSLAHGWCWLFDCAWLLAARTNLELDPGLLRFIAAVTAGGYTGEPSRASLSRTGQNLFAQLQENFEQKSFWSEDNNLLNCPAQVTMDASHIDIFYALDATPLDVRMAALDSTPGWVPWLGRVVTFHYLELPFVIATKLAHQRENYVQ